MSFLEQHQVVHCKLECLHQGEREKNPAVEGDTWISSVACAVEVAQHN